LTTLLILTHAAAVAVGWLVRHKTDIAAVIDALEAVVEKARSLKRE
jgi:hypothetical protein